MEQEKRLCWVDTHCHLDAPEFAGDVHAVRGQARDAGVQCCVLVAVGAFNFERVRALAHQFHDAYALGIHPMYTDKAHDDDLDVLRTALQRYRDDERLVAVGEIGLDFFVPGLDAARQKFFFEAQVRMARALDLPVLLHVRHSIDQVLGTLRAVFGGRGHGKPACAGIAHAFSGSLQQAQACMDMGLKLGFGGAMTFERAHNLRRLARTLPLQSLVLETDAPDMPPHWLYRTAQQRRQGMRQRRNTPSELPRIAHEVARLRAMEDSALAACTTRNACEALARLENLLSGLAGTSV